MLRHYSLLLALGLVSSRLIAAPPQIVLHGTVTTQSGEHPALFTLACTTGTGGALSLQLGVIRDTAPGFPFDAFEGPDAPASQLPSATLQVGQQSFAPVAVGGWTSGDDPDMFVFGMASSLGKRNAVTDFVAALGKPGVTITWAQNSNNMQTPPLTAKFVADAAESGELKRIAAPCLPHRR
ncbi:hypothetical protein [Dyella choica]|uniref:Uncharacterized protein n=1 Tax=Dyella choica TaxID=1927959 RepID=A0A3S0SAX0_9GAMM|nr:hypothetical protein [Dyella choica]RUL76870.1 hypothetical protein EKH80_09205 [Dyella choica]